MIGLKNDWIKFPAQQLLKGGKEERKTKNSQPIARAEEDIDVETVSISSRQLGLAGCGRPGYLIPLG